LRITVTIPKLDPPTQSPVRALGIVPLTDVSIVLPETSGRQPIVIAAILGISSVTWALVGAILSGALMLLALFVVGWRRLRRTDANGRFTKADPLLMAIASPLGYASLSQLQILLWTLVVAVSAVYVMLLSGDLIRITTGTLVLLGISGAATIGAKIHAQTDAAQATAALVTNHPRPLWSDLITNVAPDGTVEIDLTCVQMLAFTVITAVFVLLRVFTSYVIPEIPDGFQVLMGISNSVFLGSKMAQRPPVSTAQPVPVPATPPAPQPRG
jgi:hypothetical protein